MTAGPPTVPAGSGRATPSGPSGYLVAALVLFLVAPVSLLAWPVAGAALRYGARRWVLALCGLVPGIVAAVAIGPKIAAVASLTAAQVFGALRAPSVAPGGLLGPLAAWFGRWAVLTAPIGVPAGMMAAAVPPRQPAIPAPEWQARQQRARQQAEARTRKRAARRADRKAPTSAATPSPSPSAGWSPRGGSVTWSCPRRGSWGWPGC